MKKKKPVEDTKREALVILGLKPEDYFAPVNTMLAAGRTVMMNGKEFTIVIPKSKENGKADEQKLGGKTGKYEIKAADGSIGMIKLPKRALLGFADYDNSLILRELLALSIAQLLGYQSSDCHLVLAMEDTGDIIPTFGTCFDRDTVPLGHEHRDEKRRIAGNNPQFNEASLRPVGEGLIANQSIEDLGKYLVYFYLCNDLDGIGKDAQNKLLKGNRLFFIDQAILRPEDSNYSELKITRNFSLATEQSTERLDRNRDGLSSLISPDWVIRHTAFRNKSLVEEGEYIEKFKGLMHCLENFNQIWWWISGCSQYFLSIVRSEQDSQIKSIYHRFALECVSILQALETRYTNLRKKFKHEIAFYQQRTNIDKKDDALDILSSLNAFRLLFSKTKCYSTDGIPLRIPQSLGINSSKLNGIKLHSEQNTITLLLKNLSSEYLDILMNKPLSISPLKLGGEEGLELTMPLEQFKKLTPEMIKKIRYPELFPLDQSKKSYLSEQDLESSQLNAELRKEIPGLLAIFKLKDSDPLSQFQILEQMYAEVEKNIPSSAEKGILTQLKAKIAKEQQLILAKILEPITREILTPEQFKLLFENIHKMDMNHEINLFLFNALKYGDSPQLLEEIIEIIINTDLKSMGDEQLRQNNEKLREEIQRLKLKIVVTKSVAAKGSSLIELLSSGTLRLGTPREGLSPEPFESDIKHDPKSSTLPTEIKRLIPPTAALVSADASLAELVPHVPPVPLCPPRVSSPSLAGNIAVTIYNSDLRSPVVTDQNSAPSAISTLTLSTPERVS